MVDFERSQKRILFNENLAGCHEKRFFLNRSSLDNTQNHRRPVDIKFDGYSKRYEIFLDPLLNNTEKSRVAKLNANSGIFYEVD